MSATSSRAAHKRDHKRDQKRDLLDLDGLDADTITALLDAAAVYAPPETGPSESDPSEYDGAARTQPHVGEPSSRTLSGRIVANLFFEDSTRTRCSFSIAARRLGATVVDLAEGGSSMSKGETLADTARTIEAMGVDALVVRHAASGAPALLARSVRCMVINAGDGRHAHPTQGLLDLLALRERLGDFSGRRIAIVGDIGNSRVARSTLHGLVTLGAKVVLIGPPTLIPGALRAIAPDGSDAITIGHDLDAELESLDAIMMLRVQLERAAGQAIASDYGILYGLTADRVSRLRPGAPILHPGPINRGVELGQDAADDPHRSLILRQVALGVAVRMAVLEWGLVNGEW